MLFGGILGVVFSQRRSGCCIALTRPTRVHKFSIPIESRQFSLNRTSQNSEPAFWQFVFDESTPAVKPSAPNKGETGYEIKISSPQFHPNQLDNANAMRRFVHKIDDHTQHETVDERTKEGDYQDL